jgi:formylglycine-generating enzyme required for sulfatase activity
MHGNVLEWCADLYAEYNGETETDPVGPETGTRRVLRGGGWLYNARYTRSACRIRNDISNCRISYGFRFARKIQTPTQYLSINIITRTTPPWAASIGQDQYGEFAICTVKDVVFRMRWINPSEFMMGSPPDEPKRRSNELQHKVILTQGYWLGETTCTQELWQAVMGKNPSYFKGSLQLPVESVSWNYCMEFIKTINDLLPGLYLRLPTEAEWEYACRAGTQTPFSFGNTITTDHVNYRGDSYAGGKEGKYRQKTVEVKLLPCNQWGLYQMHGNVWEWCADWYAAYSGETETDPVGPETGVSRVLRGGSWIGFAQLVRSAFRSRYDPGSRFDFIGFRLARGQSRHG